MLQGSDYLVYLSQFEEGIFSYSFVKCSCVHVEKRHTYFFLHALTLDAYAGRFKGMKFFLQNLISELHMCYHMSVNLTLDACTDIIVMKLCEHNAI
jgi:hypothetical protein